MLYVYAATKTGSAAGGLLGIEGAAVELLPLGNVALAISRHAAAPEVTGPNVAAHHQVALALALRGGAVPFRFGHVFAEEALLRRETEARAADLEGKLAHVAGCIEVTLRLNSTFNIQHSTSLPGTRYLLSKKAQMEAEERLKKRLGSRVRDWRRFQRGSDVRLACLVPAATATELGRHLEGLATLTGAWAPSSFV